MNYIEHIIGVYITKRQRDSSRENNIECCLKSYILFLMRILIIENTSMRNMRMYSSIDEGGLLNYQSDKYILHKDQMNKKLLSRLTLYDECVINILLHLALNTTNSKNKPSNLFICEEINMINLLIYVFLIIKMNCFDVTFKTIEEFFYLNKYHSNISKLIKNL
jgi:hypothetical protein